MHDDPLSAGKDSGGASWAGAGQPPRALLFDLGGVLLDVDFARVLERWTPLSALTPPELRAAFRFDPAYCRHERGEITSSEYFEHLRRTLGLHASDEAIEAGWNAIFGAEIVATRDLLERVQHRIPCYLFSNSNRVHKAQWSARFPRLLRPFAEIFVSCDLGARKPEPAAFLAVARRIGLPPEAILFFDDTLENVHGARAVGMHAVHVRSTDDVALALSVLFPQS